MTQTIKIPEALVDTLLSRKGTSEITETALMTHEKVLARITDGIYRAPGSSLRELLSNAYDADATEVTINTDAPRFSRIVVRDNGQGMNLETLAYVVENIGGSTKRTALGQSMKVVSQDDPAHTQKGRRLIGKIGIGLFSVAHLSHHFKIVTKVAGNDYRSHAEVILAQYDESAGKDADGMYQQGRVRIWSEKDDAADTHGTEITVLDLKPSAVDLLRSREVWTQVSEHKSTDPDKKPTSTIAAPEFHIGEVSPQTGDIIETTAVTPWERDASPADKFKSLVTGVIDVAKTKPGQPPELETILDNYLYTIWMLGLALPFPYVNRGPLEYKSSDKVGAYVLSNVAKGQARELTMVADQRISDAARIVSPPQVTPFRVEIDGIELSRPIDILSLPVTDNSIKNPQIFVGKLKPDLTQIPASYRGGELEIYGYFAWAPKVVPTEHQGVLIRINGASGALFDKTFLRYKVAETTRLKQIVAEIFVDVGLDAALNIDRESFNYTHPHYVIVQNWVHSALRQITNQLKEIAKVKHKAKREIEADEQQTLLAKAVAQEWELAGRTEDEEVPEVLIESEKSLKTENLGGTIRLVKEVVLSRVSEKTKSATATVHLNELETEVKSIYQVLTAYRLFDTVPLETQNQVMAAIARVLDRGARK